jgi:hypothetical protein
MCETRSRERLAAHDHVRHTEREAEFAHLVLEELAQGLEEFELHALRQAADVVMRLDLRGGLAFGAARLDHIGIDGALHEKARAGV